MLISIILPTYNEKANVIPLIQSIRSVCSSAGIESEVLVIDDDSADGTEAAISETFGGDETTVRCYVRKNERGLASAIAHGVCRARGDYLLIMDSDFNHDPNVIPELLCHITEHDLVTGSRFVSGGGMEKAALRYWCSYAYNIIIRLGLGLRTRDNLSGFFVVRRSVLDGVCHRTVFAGYGEYFIRLLYHAHRLGLRIKEIPVYYLKRTTGASKTRFFQYSMTILKTIFILRVSKAPFLKQVFVDTEAYQSFFSATELLSQLCI